MVLPCKLPYQVVLCYTMVYRSLGTGIASQPIWLNNLQCTSNEICISDCQSCPSGQSNSDSCTHSLDVSLKCGNIF